MVLGRIEREREDRHAGREHSDHEEHRAAQRITPGLQAEVMPHAHELASRHHVRRDAERSPAGAGPDGDP
jgi:hypothetical protein